jgi:DNA repair exonuclease SbcCD ATPase subunit
MGIEFALYETTKEYLSWNEESGFVELEFSHNGDVYIVKKDFTKTEYTVTVWKNGALLSESKSETKNFILELLGISKDMLENTLFQSQKLNVSFANMTPKLKASFIMELLDITKWEKYHKTAGQLYKGVIDALKRCGMKEELLTAEITRITEDLGKANEDEVRRQLEFHTRGLNLKKDQLKMFEQTEFLMSQRISVNNSLTKAQSGFNSTKQVYDSLVAELTKYRILKTEIDKDKVLAPDMNYKSSVLQSSLSIEKQIAATEQEIKVRREHIRDKQKKSKTILEASICPTCMRPIDDSYHEQVSLTLQNEEMEMENYIVSLNNNIAGLSERKKQLSSEINELTQSATLYELHIAKKREVYDKIDNADGKLIIYSEQMATALEDIKVFTIQLNDIDVKIQGYDAAQTDILRRDILSKEAEVKKFQTELYRIDSMRTSLVDKSKEVETVKAEQKEHSRAFAILKHTCAMFSSSGIQKWLFVNTLGEITSLANSLLDPVGFKVRFIFEKQKTSTDGFKPAFDIYVIKNHAVMEELPLHLLSGGEGAMVNFALRLAFSTIVAITSDFSFMILDEGFSNLDTKNREVVSNMLLQLSKQFQLFVITHLSDIESYFTNTLIVEKRNGVSQVVN